MNQGIKTIIYPVRDVAKAKALYGVLAGAAPVADQPYYVGYTVGDQHVGLLPNGHEQGMTGPVAYWHVDDIRKSISALITQGAKPLQEIKDVGAGRLIGSVTDADGNVVALLQDP